MGEQSVLEKVDKLSTCVEAEVMADETYIVRSVQSTDTANLSSIGFGALDVLDGIEIIGVTPTPPDDYMTTSTGGFPIMIIYGMAGMAAIGGIGFFIMSSRSMKKAAVGQQGIDPSRLVGYQTSASSGGYQTNRGEAQLKTDTDYTQSRNVYDDTQETTTQETTTQETTPQETTLKKLSLNKLCHQVVKKLHVDVLHLLKLVLNVIVKCKVHAYVMQLVVVMQIFVKNKFVK